MSNHPRPFHETVAEQLIARLKQGTAPWQLPWQSGQPGAVLPLNPTTGKRYKGINALHLMAQPYADQRWMTYKQAAAAGAQVRPCEKGTPIQYWKFNDEKIVTDADGKPLKDSHGEPLKQSVRLERPRVFFATVFNAAQIDGLPPARVRAPREWNVIDRAENILKASGAVIRHGEQHRAFYRPATDSIHLPNREQFASADAYYATALHELGHWTGHATRLQRDLVHPYGSAEYAREELRAEIASMILGDELGVGHDPSQHAAYVGAWIKVLQEDPLEIFRAAADAEKIQGYVLGLQQSQEQAVEQARLHEEQVRVDPESTSEAVSASRKEREDAEHVQRTAAMVLPRQVEEVRPVADKVFLDVPFKQKEDAKALGAKWDRQAHAWFIPATADPGPFAQWMVASHNEAKSRPPAKERHYLAVPFDERREAKSAGALWDRSAMAWYAGPAASLDKLARWNPGITPAQQGVPISPEDEFAEALRSVGCVVTGDHPIMDGYKHRISVEGESTGNKTGAGFYVAYRDGHPAGYIKNNKSGAELKWKSKGYVLDPAQKARLQIEVATRRQARRAEQALLQEKAAVRIAQRLATLEPVWKATPYLQTKGIAPQRGIFTDSEGRNTYIPGIDTQGQVRTLQTIREDGTKRFTKDSRKEGCFHVVGGLEALATAPALVIGEGYATACSLSQSLGFATVVAFDSGNLPHVAKALHQQYPDKPVVIAGDNDQHLEATLGVNPGKVKALEAAEATGGTVLLPIFAPGERENDPRKFTDFNDLANNSVLGKFGIGHQVRPVVESAVARYRSMVKLRQEQVALPDTQLVRHIRLR